MPNTEITSFWPPEILSQADTVSQIPVAMAVFLALAAGGTSSAFSKDSDQWEKDCQTSMDKSDGSNAAWGCGQEWLKREDDKWNATWGKVMEQALAT